MSVQTADPIAQGAEFLARGDLAAAERCAGAVLAVNENPDALHLLGLVRIHQQRLEDAVPLLLRSLSLRPGHAHVQLNLGRVLALLKRDSEALPYLEKAGLADPTLTQAWFELGETAQRLGDQAKAEMAFRKVLALEPGQLFARLALGSALKEQGRPLEAESMLASGLNATQDPRLKAAFAYNLGMAQYDQGKREAALENFSLVAKLEPAKSSVEITRTDLLQELQRFDEAERALKDLIAREPGNEAAHVALNDLVWRLGREEEFLKSYDRAPPSTGLQLSKANFLHKTKRTAEAHDVYAAILVREPGDPFAAIGAADTLNKLARPRDAMAVLEKARLHNQNHVPLHQHLAATALQLNDPQKAAAFAEKCLRLAPVDYYGLALLGTAWRMMADERDEMLNGYDDLIQVYELEAPKGFSSMADFNAELNTWLDRMHPYAREPIDQSLRGGSQTRGNIFTGGHDLVDRLKQRISEALDRYIAAIKPDALHPFRGRRANGFRFTGSWSSRLRDCGFHINHIHPEGWISSCYYIGVPDAVKDGNQGWIKFGEPGFETGLSHRRAIQPVPGRLVLFPSYMWHGTIPFRDAAPRTTIAFDAVPR